MPQNYISIKNPSDPLSKSPMFRLIIVYLLWHAASVLGGSLIYLYFKNAGLSVIELAFSFMFWASAPLILMRFLDNWKKLDMKQVLVAGVLLQSLQYVCLISAPPSSIILYTASFFFGCNSFLFWVPFNSLYFEHGKGKEASLSSLYYAINPLFGIFLPVIGGFIAQSLGFTTLFSIALLPYLILVLISFFVIPNRQFAFSLSSCLNGLTGFRTLILIEGIYGGGIACAVAVISLFYFRTPSELGIFLSATTLFSVIASFIISRISDKSRKRKAYISYTGSALGIVSCVAAFATTALGWAGAISLRNFVSALFYPFTTAIIMDKKTDLASTMVAREWLLNYGRIIGIGVVLFCHLILQDIHLSMAFLGLAIVAYPLALELKKHHIKVD
jgi:MFS family permease